MTDELRPIPGYEGIYAVTRDGRVWSYPKAPPPGKQGRTHAGRWMSPARTASGASIALSKDGVKRTVLTRPLAKRVWADNSPTPSKGGGSFTSTERA